MPKKIQGSATRGYIESIPLPQHASSYCCIPHKFVIDHTHQLLTSNGLEVETELYKCSISGDVAQGVYYLKDNQDPEIAMMFAWANSYDKTMKFKCSIGARVITSGATIIAGDVANWGRVHKGTADKDTIATITDQIKNAHRYFTDLVNDKALMKGVMVSREDQASLLGIMFICKEYIKLEQLNVIKSEMKKPSFDYNADPNSLWAFYNHILVGIKGSHPKHWLDRQRNIHWFLCNQFKIGKYNAVANTTQVKLPTTKPVIEEQLPGQVDIEDMIAEVEKEKSGPVVTEMTESGEILATSEVKLPDGLKQIGPTKVVERSKSGAPLISVTPVEMNFSQGLHTDDGLRVTSSEVVKRRLAHLEDGSPNPDGITKEDILNSYAGKHSRMELPGQILDGDGLKVTPEVRQVVEDILAEKPVEIKIKKKSSILSEEEQQADEQFTADQQAQIDKNIALLNSKSFEL